MALKRLRTLLAGLHWPDFRDAHIYGGLALFAVAGLHAFGWAGVMPAGAALFYLGVWRLG